MPLRALTVASAIILAIAGMSVSASAQTRHDQAATSKKKPPVPAQVPVQDSAQESAQEGRIACTIGGCHPIPANCTTTMGQTPMGGTGYEIVHCP